MDVLPWLIHNKGAQNTAVVTDCIFGIEQENKVNSSTRNLILKRSALSPMFSKATEKTGVVFKSVSPSNCEKNLDLPLEQQNSLKNSVTPTRASFITTFKDQRRLASFSKVFSTLIVKNSCYSTSRTAKHP
ncbi:hypothetical protein E2C01_049077 [Portunus trituberculatus]|uniref:Uncharacterized protein n=1 Tax=Portunus trituberculatus TaxID=210409 RepID=A0A5B7GC78_PORTR|nr:hypothetical protein [Portunus trituberculatus]